MSNINPQNIDGTFPIAGQDNNSQGFRDNFTNTINNFTFAAAELADLQTYAVVTGPLTSVGQTGTPTNNMNYTYLTKPQLLGAVETSKNIGNIATSGNIQVDWSQGHYQTVGATGTVGLTFTSTWPTTSLYTKLRLQIKAWGTTVINLDTTARPVNINSIQGVSGNVLTLSDGLYQFEFATSDQGATISIVDLWRNYDTATQFESLSVAGNILSTGLSVFGNATLGLAGVVSGQFHTVVGNITQTSSGGAVYINTTGNVLAASVTTGALINNGNIIIADPIGAGSFGSNLTVKGTIQSKYWNYTNVVSSSDTISLMPGGDSLKLVQINANLDIGYNNPMVAGSKVEYTVQNINSGNVWVNLPNKNTNLGKGNVFVLGNSYTRFVFTAFGSNAAMVTVSTDGRA